LNACAARASGIRWGEVPAAIAAATAAGEVAAVLLAGVSVTVTVAA
jgi:hypothetical protein